MKTKTTKTKKKASAAAEDRSGRQKTRNRRRIWNIALGIFFFILGVIGILIPVMPQLVSRKE